MIIESTGDYIPIAAPETRDLFRILQPLDVFYTRKPTWMSRAIRWAEQEKGEEKSLTSHVGAIVTAGTIRRVKCIEALSRVRRHSLWKQYAFDGTEMTIFRPRNISYRHKDKILDGLRRRVGQRYGYSKIGLHLLVKLTGKRKWLNLTFLDRFPICSYALAIEFGRLGYHFGVSDRKADPDDMLDFSMANPDKWECVRPWGQLN